MPLPPSIMAFLTPWMAQQRWYAGKGRVPVLRHIGGLRLEDPAEEVDIKVHLLLDESGRTPTTYQVPLTCRTERLAGADHALVATEEAGTEGGDGRLGRDRMRYFYDAPHDPAFATALLALMLDEQHAGFASGHRLATADPGELSASHVLVGEQSNTCLLVDLVDTLGAPMEPLICKVFRVLQD